MKPSKVEEEAPVVMGRSVLRGLRRDRDRLSGLIAEGPLDVGRALQIAHQIASALAEAHARGALHGALNPHGVRIVERDGEPASVELFDLDDESADLTPTSAETPYAFEQLRAAGRRIFAAPAYLSPEQELGRAIDARSDLYSLGIVMFEMLTGSRPFEVEGKHMVSALKVMYDPPAMLTVRPDIDIPLPVEAIVRRLLARERAERFQDAGEVVEAIEACDDWAPPSSARTGRGALGRRRLWAKVPPFSLSDLLAGLAAGLLLFFVGGALLRSSAPPSPRPKGPVSSFYRPTLRGSEVQTPPDEPLSEEAAEKPATETNATAQAPTAASPKSAVRKKPLLEVTDFGGRR